MLCFSVVITWHSAISDQSFVEPIRKIIHAHLSLVESDGHVKGHVIAREIGRILVQVDVESAKGAVIYREPSNPKTGLCKSRKVGVPLALVDGLAADDQRLSGLDALRKLAAIGDVLKWSW